MAHWRLATAVAVVLMSFEASAQPRDLGADLGPAQEALAAGNYIRAYDQFLYFAEHDDNSLAQFTVALFYDFGWGRPADPVLACQWHERAAGGEIPQAQVRLAECLLNGVHRTADSAAAAEWYRRAAENGIPMALCELAKIYIAGQGVVRDQKEGLALCQSVAEQGIAKAMTQLGKFYLEGDDEIRNFGLAFDWFSRAAESRSVEGMYFLATMMRDGLVINGSPEAARFWFESAAAVGYVPAYYPTARLYYLAGGDPETGVIAAEDLAKLYMWLQLTIKRSGDDAELAEAKKMLTDVMQLIPDRWLTELDEKIAQHIKEISPRD